MTMIPQTECSTMLGIDPKTLRNWLRHTHMQFAAHPTDARLKCLTATQVQQLATLHHRPLPSTNSLPPSGVPEADLSQILLRLQAQVTTLQEQLAQLALEVLRERELRSEQRLSSLEALIQHMREPHPALPAPDLPQAASPPELQSLVQRRVSSHVLPLIASAAAGTYVVISPVLGELPFLPESPAWFEWLATLNSFRFLGQQGRLSTYRNTGRSCWMAYRRIHGHRYEYALGHTERLTIDRLEQMAATLQSHLISL